MQTDCKGHPGYTSWFSQTPTASVPPGLKKDGLRGWREATKRLGLPLHCHYSGIWDRAAGEKRPEWAAVHAPSKDAIGQSTPAPKTEKMCPRRGYLENLLMPQMHELIDRYEVDGFWVDGDIWAAVPCYCELCRAAFTTKTGIEDPPTETDDPNWPAWIQFTLDSFEEYVTRYCEAVHAYRPGVLVCSNWLQTFRHPGEPRVPTDWISGDNSWVWGMDGSRCEARFISTRGKPWDIMLWSFYRSHGMNDIGSPWVFKPVQMLQQEAAVTLALGGNIQIYENSDIRDGRLVPWRIEELRKVRDFVHARRTLCQDTVTIPQIAVLHSEHHLRRHMGRSLFDVDVAPVRGAVFSLLELHYGVDILDEWALLPQLAQFPVVVAPERNDMSEEMAQALKRYVRAGGKLLVSGADAYERFGADFLGVQTDALQENAVYHLPVAGKAVAVFSRNWRLVELVTAEGYGLLGINQLLEQGSRPYPAFTINRYGRGAVAHLPFDVFRFFQRNRYPLVREFLGELMQRLADPMPIRVEAPTCIDVVLRRKGEAIIIHLINRASGIPNTPNNGAIDEIPPMGPVRISVDLPGPPQKVYAAFEPGELQSSYAAGCLQIELAKVYIHTAVVVES
ncbi:MAG: hypothetical protein GX162_06060 [Firmicutes bacterium]|nr:hypothetical protein [Bacillota bacterium]